jgi:predicted site-specific integrase-resolvase
MSYQNLSQNPESLIPAAQAADLLGISLQTFHAWRKHGFLATVKLPSGRHAITPKELYRVLPREDRVTANEGGGK